MIASKHDSHFDSWENTCTLTVVSPAARNKINATRSCHTAAFHSVAVSLQTSSILEEAQ